MNVVSNFLNDLFLGFLRLSDTYSVPIALSAAFLTLAIFFHLVYLQVREIFIIRDYLDKYRYYLLALLVTFLLCMIPVTWYFVYRLLGIQNEPLRNVASLAGRLGPLFIAIALELIYAFRRK